ncbi:MAG: hypothetical protein WB441_01535, partial [Nocardioidaceae bacterium]
RAGPAVAPVPHATPRPAAARGGEPEPLRVLHQWDADRARAYAAASPSGLGALYAPGSSAGVHDAALLRRYRDRGLRVTGLRTQVLAIAVLERRPGRWRLRVTDRIVGGSAVPLSRPGPAAALPRDAPTTRVITLVRGEGPRWRVSGVAATER